ncbi:hypothetical protein VEx25_B0233, partial [Vibrio antiquarius]
HSPMTSLMTMGVLLMAMLI